MIDAAAKVARFAGASETGAGWLFAVVAEEPGFAANNDDALSLIRLIGAPLRPVLSRTASFGIEEELIEDHADATGPQPLGESPDALTFGVASLAVAEEDFGHDGCRAFAGSSLCTDPKQMRV